MSSHDHESCSRILSSGESLHRFVRSTLPKQSLVDSDDIVQETLAEAWRNRSKLRAFKNVSEVGVWLRTVAKRKVIDRFRRAQAMKRNNGEFVVRLVECDVPKGGQRTPSSFVASQECGDILASALDRLTERHRQAIQLRFYRQLTFSAAADELGISEKATQMLVKRALVCLKQELGGRKSKFL